jgi:hypothetical protein
MIGHRKGDEAFVLALASGRTIKEAAEVAGIGYRTATRRLADPAFQRLVQQARADMVQRAVAKLADGLTEAVDTVRKLLGAKADTVKLGAARAMLELATKLRESVEIESRVCELERRTYGGERS